MTININPEEHGILIESLQGRINRLYNDSEAYREGGNKEAQMDCLEEKRRVQRVLDRFLSI